METAEIDIRKYIVEKILFSKNGFPCPDDASFLEEGIIDSTSVLELVMFIEDKYKISVDDSEIIPENFDSVAKLANYVRSKKNYRKN